MYIDKSLKVYLDDLAAKKAAPGGGSASALVGAEGTALLIMAANFTLGKERYRQYDKEVCSILAKLEDLRKRFMVQVDGDVEAYTKLAGIFKIKKGAPIDEDLKEASGVPMDIAKSSLEALKLGLQLVDKANPNLISDVGVGNEFLSAAYEGAKYNIEINLNSMRDREHISKIRADLGAMDKEVFSLKKAINDKVKSIMGNG